jgi:hypothetical protein
MFVDVNENYEIGVSGKPMPWLFEKGESGASGYAIRFLYQMADGPLNEGPKRAHISYIGLDQNQRLCITSAKQPRCYFEFTDMYDPKWSVKSWKCLSNDRYISTGRPSLCNIVVVVVVVWFSFFLSYSVSVFQIQVTPCPLWRLVLED